MKKIFFMLFISVNAHAYTPSWVSGCEKIYSDYLGKIYKCQQNSELDLLQSMNPNAMFTVESGAEYLKTLAMDTQYVYVNINMNDECDVAGQEAHTYRVMVKNPTLDGQTMYAVEVCR